MKKWTKWLSVILIMAMLIPCCSFLSSAATADTVRSYNSILALGSSITRGYGLMEDWGITYEERAYYEGSFPTVLADATKVPDENREIFTYGGMTSSAMLVMLGEEEDFTDEYDVNGFAYGNLIMELRDDPCFTKPLSEAELITLEFGMGDVFYRAVVLSGISYALGKDTATLVEALERYVYYTYDGYRNLMENMSRILASVTGKNQNATVLLIGMYNPLANVALDSESVLPVGSALSAVTMLINAGYKRLAKQYDNVTYVDVSNVETGATNGEYGLLSDEFFGKDAGAESTHPTRQGYHYMAQQCIGALPVKEGEKQVSKNNIVLALCDVEEIVGITIGNTVIRNYSWNADTRVLTIPRIFRSTGIMTLTAKIGGGGGIGCFIYQVTYHDGYEAYRLYSTPNTLTTAEKLGRKIGSVAETVMQKLSGIFNR